MMPVRIFFVFCLISSAIFLSCNGNEKQTITQAENNSGQASDLKKSLAKYPDSLLLSQKLIEYYRDNGEYDSAIAITDNLIKRDSNIAELWNIKATLNYENEDTLGAIKSFEKAINLIPLPQYIISLGTLYAQTKNSKSLILADALMQANKAKPSKEAFFIKGLYFTYTVDKKKAIALFDSCIKIDYAYMFAYREKAIALYDQGKYEDALKVLTRAVTVQNNFDEGYYWIGNCYKKLNRKEEAIQSYHTALLYDKDFVEARDSLRVLEEK